jgi:hypothetical protein
MPCALHMSAFDPKRTPTVLPPSGHGLVLVRCRTFEQWSEQAQQNSLRNDAIGSV